MSISVALDGGVAVVTIDRQDALNALDLPTLTDLRDRLVELAADAGARVVVLTGAGEKAFAAGADIKEMSSKTYAQMFSQNFFGAAADRIAAFRKPIIAAVAGYALGGGCSPATCVTPPGRRSWASPRSTSESSLAGAARSASRAPPRSAMRRS